MVLILIGSVFRSSWFGFGLAFVEQIMIVLFYNFESQGDQARISIEYHVFFADVVIVFTTLEWWR